MPDEDAAKPAFRAHVGTKAVAHHHILGLLPGAFGTPSDLAADGHVIGAKGFAPEGFWVSEGHFRHRLI
jgi:hypothetical protein